MRRPVALGETTRS